MATYTYPTSKEIHEIEQKQLPILEEGRIGLELFPVETSDSDEVYWEQKDDYLGLQQVRGLDGSPGRVKKTGAKQYSMAPGAYGEFEQISERELTRRRQLGTFGTPIDISDLVGTAEEKLLQRELDRIEYIVWTLLQSGTFSVANHNGILHTDTFPILTSTPGTAWSTTSTSTPVADLRTIRLNQRGYSAGFGRAAKLYMNQKKVNQLLSNSNTADLGKYTMNGGDKLVTLDDVNKILLAQDLPMIVEYDRGYYTDAGVWTPFIADTKAILVAPRLSGAPVGRYYKTRNANNPDLAPGSYMKVIDREDVPRKVEVHRGHNGGPALEFPGSVVAITC